MENYNNLYEYKLQNIIINLQIGFKIALFSKLEQFNTAA